MPENKVIDWQTLIDHAKISYKNAYAPYSNFKVGAAAYTEKGLVVNGCNVENASYGLTVCAEQNCIAQAVINAEQVLTAMAIYTEQEKLTPPCGACRQVISEFFQPSSFVMATNHLGQQKIWTVAALLPDAFSSDFLL